MQCSRCLNTDEKYFFHDGNTVYCRKCIQFGRINIGEEMKAKSYTCKKHRVKEKLSFELTPSQLDASHQLKEYASSGKDCLVYACCGAGKTEICFEVITYFLNSGKKVGFAISRRQVVLEICERLKKAYPSLKVIAVCQGHTDVDDGDLIVCTMHQLYRYTSTFDLLIMDEVDAFPYKNNEVLENIAMHSCKGVKVYLTATPTEKMLEEVQENKLKMIELFMRPHGHELVVPKIILIPFFMQILFMYIHLQKYQRQWLIFLPTISQVNAFTKIFSYIIPCKGITSKTTNSEEILEQFKNKQFSVLFTSTILERGITIKGVDVMVLESNHPVFDEASLIQIVGRVGRDPNNPTGYAYLLASNSSHAMKRCVNAIRKMNESLSDLLS